MLNLNKVALVASGLLVCTAGAIAQGPTAETKVATVPLTSTLILPTLNQAKGSTTGNPISLHAGVMVNPRGAAIVGADVDLPTLSVGSGWHGRADVDFIIKANLGGVNTLTIATIDQLYYSSNGANGHNVYWGGGLGALIGGGADFDAKLILGTELTSKFGAEANIHFNKRNTLINLLGRLHF